MPVVVILREIVCIVGGYEGKTVLPGHADDGPVHDGLFGIALYMISRKKFSFPMMSRYSTARSRASFSLPSRMRAGISPARQAEEAIGPICIWRGGNGLILGFP